MTRDKVPSWRIILFLTLPAYHLEDEDHSSERLHHWQIGSIITEAHQSSGLEWLMWTLRTWLWYDNNDKVGFNVPVNTL